MGRSLESRLAKVERKLTQIDDQEKLATCICHALVGVGRGTEAEFRAEMNRVCPAHGFRELTILHFIEVEPARDLFSRARIIENAKVDELLMEYNRRLAEAKRAA